MLLLEWGQAVAVAAVCHGRILSELVVRHRACHTHVTVTVTVT